MNKSSAIYILGGMGPQASAYLYKLLIDMSIRDFGAKNNDDFPEIILHSVPVPDFISSDHHKKALVMLKKRVKEAEKLNISCLSIACNTAHIFMSDLQKVSKVQLISIIESAVDQVKEDKLNKLGLLVTPSAIKYQLYQQALQKYGISSLVPTKEQLRVVESIVRNILKGKIAPADREKLVIIANSLKKRGAQGIILGCTELPLVFPSKYSLPVYNSVKILALALLRNYYK